MIGYVLLQDVKLAHDTKDNWIYDGGKLDKN